MTRRTDKVTGPALYAGGGVTRPQFHVRFTQQLAQLEPLAEQGFAAAQKAEKTVQDKYEKLKPTLAQAQQLLVASFEVPPETASAVADLRQAKEEASHQQRTAIAAILQRVRSVLGPRQRALIDWQRPADLISTDSERRLARLRRLAAEMRRAIEFLERLRYRDPFNYIQTRMGEVEAYLSTYVPRQSPRFPELHTFVIQMLDRMKMVEEPDWPGAAPELAAELLLGVGAVPSAPGPGPPDRPLGWEDLYEVFSSPHTAELVKQMLQMRTQPPAISR